MKRKEKATAEKQQTNPIGLKMILFFMQNYLFLQKFSENKHYEYESTATFNNFTT